MWGGERGRDEIQHYSGLSQRVFLHSVFRGVSLFVKGERRLVLKSRFLLLTRATCPAKSLGFVSPTLGVLVLKGLPSSTPGSQLTLAGVRLAPARFLTRPLGRSY